MIPPNIDQPTKRTNVWEDKCAKINAQKIKPKGATR
jgi:hypothetical protein